MRLPWQKKQQPYVYTWESEPFVFQKGMIYVIEVNMASGILIGEVEKLKDFFFEQGVVVKLVLVQGKQALNPVTVKRKKEQISNDNTAE